MRRPRAALAIALAVTAPAAVVARDLALETGFVELLPAEHPAVRDLETGIARTGGSAFTLVAIGAGDRRHAERFADALATRLERLPAVRYAEAHLPVEFLADHGLLFLDAPTLEQLREEVADAVDLAVASGAGLVEDLTTPTTASSAVDATLTRLRARFAGSALGSLVDPIDGPARARRYSVGKDGRYLYVFAKLSGEAGDLAFGRAAEAEVEATARRLRDELGPADLELRFTGPVVIRVEEDDILRRDLAVASAIGFASVVLLLVLYTRRLSTLVLLGLPLLASLTITLAFARLAVGRLNIISGFLVTILSGLGIEFGIHLLMRHRELRQRGLGVEAATLAAVRATAPSLFSSAATNAAAFYVLSFAGFQGFAEFGVIAGTGMGIALVVTLATFPALNVLLDRGPAPGVPRDTSRALHSTRPSRPFPALARRLVLLAFPLAGLTSIVELAAGRVELRTNFRELKGESPASDFDDYVIESLGQTLTESLVVTATAADLPRVVATIRAVEAARRARGAPVGVDEVRSVLDLVPPDQSERAAIAAEIAAELERVPEERLGPADRERLADAIRLARARPFSLADLPAALTRRFDTEPRGGGVVVMETPYLFYDSREVVGWAAEMDELEAALADAGVDAAIVSENWIAGTIFALIDRDGPFILGATFAVVFAVLLVTLRRLGSALVVLGALALGQLAMAGTMGLFGIELNFMNAAVLPIVVGVSVDNGVHVYHRFRAEGRGALGAVLRHTVVATSLASLANLLGFGAMVFAHHEGLESVGVLAIVGIGWTFLSTSLFFPLALDAWSARLSRATRPPGTSSPPPTAGGPTAPS